MQRTPITRSSIGIKISFASALTVAASTATASARAEAPAEPQAEPAATAAEPTDSPPATAEAETEAPPTASDAPGDSAETAQEEQPSTPDGSESDELKPIEPAPEAAVASSPGFTATPTSAAVSDPWRPSARPSAGALTDPFTGARAAPRPASSNPNSPSVWGQPGAVDDEPFDPLPAYLPPPTQPRSPPPVHPLLSGYGGVALRGGSLAGKFAAFSGVRGGLIVHRFMVGAAFYRLQHRFARPIAAPDGRQFEFDMGYGGLTLGAQVWRGRLVEVGFGGLIGAGRACLGDGACFDGVRMFVAEPEATVYVNVAKWMRLRIGAGYRFVRRSAWNPPNDFMMAGGYAELGVEFGWFRRR